MATLVGEIRDKEETALSFNPGGSHIQIESISIEISSGEINKGMEECNHFSIRGFVRKQRNKDSRLCSPFISDADGDKSSNNNNIASSLELPPLDVHKFKWWRCSGCLQDCNSPQGEGSNSKSLPKRRKNEFLQQETSSFSNLLSAKEAGGSGISDNQRSAAKEKQLVDEEPNLKGKGLLIQDEDDDYSKIGVRLPKDSFITDDVLSAGLECFGTPRPSRRSAGLSKLDSSFGSAISKLVMGPPKNSSKKNSSTRPEADGTAKTTSAISYHQNVLIPHNAGQTTAPPPAATIRKKTNYAKRSVQQPDRAVGDSVAMGGDSLMPERFNDGHVPPQLGINQGLGSSSTSTKKVPNYSTAGRAPDQGQSHQFVEDTVEDDFYPLKDGTDKKYNSVCPLVESNRLFKKPRIDLELEAAGRNNMYAHLRRAPKIRLLSDVIAKNPTNVGEQPHNSKACAAKFSDQSTKRKASPVASHETPSEGRGVSDKAASEQSTKSKNPRFASLDDSPPRRDVSVSGSWNKRKRSTVQHSVHFDEPDKTVPPTRRYNRPDMEPSAKVNFIADAKNAFHGSDAEKKSKTRVQNASPSSVPSPPRQASRDDCETPLSSNRFSSGQAAACTPVHGSQATHGTIDKSNKNIFCPEKDKRIQGFGKHISIPQIEKDHQPGTKILKFGPENAPEEGTSDCIIIGSGSKRRGHTEKGGEIFSAPSSTMKDYLKTSVSTGNELWNSHVQAGGLLAGSKGGEGSSCTQQNGVKGRVKDIDINSIPVDEKTPESGVADDIPMDIVELLAKLQQQERRYDPNREKLSVKENVNVGENSSAQKLNSNCLLKPQASYSYANNGAGRLFEPISTSSEEKKVSSDGSLFDHSWKNGLVGCPNDDPLALGARFTAYNAQSQVQVPGAAGKSWAGNMGPFSPVSRLQPAVQSFFSRPPPPPQLNTQIWGPRSVSSSYNSRVAPDMGQLGMYMRHSQLNIGNPNPSSSTTQSWTCTEYAPAAAATENGGGGRQNITRQFVFPATAARPPSNETIPAMQLVNLVQVAGSSGRSSGNTAEFLRKSKIPFDKHWLYSSNPPYAPGPHFEPYNKLNTAAGAACTSRAGGSSSDHMFASAAPTVTSHTPSVFLTDRRFSSGNKTTKAKKKPAAPTAKNAAIPSQSALICLTNRNPAEMILDSKQARSFMISPEDLRPRRKPTIAPKPHTVY